MSDIVIRPLQGEEMLATVYGLAAYAFHPSPPLTDRERWTDWMGARQGNTCLALFEDGIPAACAISTAMIQNVRGALYGQAGAWCVVTAPAARRKGYCRRLMTDLFAAGHAAGQAFTCLYPFRESFYEQLGYVTFPAPQLARLTPQALTPLLKNDLGGQIKLLRIRDGFDDYQNYLHDRIKIVHGMTIFEQVDLGKARQNSLWQAEVWIDGRLEGMMLYELQGREGGEGEFNFCAHAFYYDTSPAKYLLLQWIARHVDQAASAVLMLPPFERPETWLSDLRVKSETFPPPMGRVLDVSKIGGMQVGPGCFSLRISDPCCPWNAGAWQFASLDGLLQVSRVEQAQCTLSIQGLSALVYGAHAVGDFAFRGWGDPTQPLQAAMQSMFPHKLPFLDEMF